MDLVVRCRSLEPTAHSLVDALKPDVQARVGIVGLQQQVDCLRNLRRPTADTVRGPGGVSVPAMQPRKNVGRGGRADSGSCGCDHSKGLTPFRRTQCSGWRSDTDVC